jgi:glucose-1-phosphate adenylyltransferase
MKLLESENLEELFSGNQIYTKIRDDNPTRYVNGSKAKNVLVADGCVIEGEIENCVLFRGVHVAKGAKVKNCVLMQDTTIGKDAKVEYVITDKNVTITDGKSLTGNDSYQVFVSKRQVV